MSSSTSVPNPNSQSQPNFDEQRWIINIRRALDQDSDSESDNETPISIFNVPKALMLQNPDSYVPQQIALGPYHHTRPELHEMERYKLYAAKRFQKHLQPLKFHNLVDHLTKFDPKIRSFYHKYLNFNGETLIWMMAVDSCFLLEFLQFFVVKEEKPTRRISSRRRKSVHDGVVRDMVMLENQIPLFVLKKMLEFQLESSEESGNLLYEMLMEFCKKIVPFEMIHELPSVDQVVGCAHLLDLLYHLIVPKSDESEITIESEDEEIKNCDKSKFLKVISKLKPGVLSLIGRVLVSKLIQFILKLPCKIISILPGVIIVKQLEYFCFSQRNSFENQNSESNKSIKRPSSLNEEIVIPSVTELSKAGLKFSATNACVFSVNFDEKTATFYLPMITLDANTEVAMRNLVAYEACGASGPLIFTRYTELMNGIIDTEEDAKILREKGIILNHLKSDQDVANVWNGMGKSVRLTKVPFLDKVIEDVNNYYNRRWKVIIGNFMARRVFASWQSLTLMAAILLLFLMSLQVFSSMFGCVRLFLEHKMMN